MRSDARLERVVVRVAAARMERPAQRTPQTRPTVQAMNYIGRELFRSLLRRRDALVRGHRIASREFFQRVLTITSSVAPMKAILMTMQAHEAFPFTVPFAKHPQNEPPEIAACGTMVVFFTPRTTVKRSVATVLTSISSDST
eukprot:2969605-Rhodomonas_salina.2